MSEPLSENHKPLLKNLRALVTSSRVQAIVAALGLVLSGAVAWHATKSAQEVKEEATKANRQLQAAEQQAKAAEKSLTEARDLVEVTRLLRDEAARAVEVAKDQVAQAKADNYELRRARARFAGTQIMTREIGKPLTFETRFNNIGREEPKNIRVYTYSAALTPGMKINRDTFLACSKIYQNPGMNWVDGKFYQDSIFDWTKELEQDFIENKRNIYAYGRLCYLDSAGTEYIQDFCAVHFSNGNSLQCTLLDK